MKEIPFKQRFEKWTGLEKTHKRDGKEGIEMKARAKAQG